MSDNDKQALRFAQGDGARLSAALADRYRIERELGSGGMATVYLARDLKHDRDVAIKVLRPDIGAALGAARFLLEIKTTANLRHAHIVPLYDSGEVKLDAAAAGDGPPQLLYYVMPVVEGESLRDRLARDRQLPVEEALRLGREVADALGYAHARGVIHRDIKPENIMLEHGRAVVADFGIARAVSAAGGERITQTGMSMGTPLYMSPEQASGESDADARSDQYSLGCVLYEMLAGQPPFTGPNAAAIARQHLIAEPAPVSNLRAGVAPPVVAAIARALAKAPADRFDGMTAFAAALSSATTSGEVRQETPPRARGRSFAVGAAAVLLLAVAGAAILRARTGSATLALEPKRVVIATFENKSGDPRLDPLGAMAADWIARGLVGTGLVDVGGTSADLASRGVASRAAPGESPIQALARDANAGLVISGAYYRQGDSVLFQADFTDANAKRLVQTVGPVSALASAPLTGVERLRQQVIAGLAPLVDSSLTMQASLITRPPSIEAYREFLAGEAQFYSDERGAVEHYLRAAAYDTTYALPLLRAILALSNAGEAARFDSVTRTVRARRARLTPYEQAYFDYVSCTDPARCLAATTEMVRLTPRSQFTPYLNAITLRWANRPHAADSILRGLDPRSGELRGRIYYVTHYAGILHVLGEHERELAVVRGAGAQYPGRLSVARVEVAALVALGRLAEADRAIDAMFTLQPDLRTSALRGGTQAVYDLRWHGHGAAAESLGLRLLRRMEAGPAAPAGTRDERDRAELLAAMHRWPELEAWTGTMLRADPANLVGMRLRGVAFAMQGKRAAALAIDSALAATTTPLRPQDECYADAVCRGVARAYIAAALGDKARAVSLLNYKFFNDAFAHYDLIGEWLRDYPPFQDFIKPRG